MKSMLTMAAHGHISHTFLPKCSRVFTAMTTRADFSLGTCVVISYRKIPKRLWNGCKVPSTARPKKRNGVVSAASVNTSKQWKQGPYEEGELKQPRYTGDDPLSSIVSGLISVKPLFAVMKLAARQVFIGTAENKGIPWRRMTEELLSSDVYAEKELIENKSLGYPDYYLQEFHAYNEGNLSWQAAAEAEAATMSMVRRAIPAAESMEEALDVLRGNWLRAIEAHHSQHSSHVVSQVLDIGCSVGTSTLCLAEKFPAAQVTGLDLSPYFLAVAQYHEKQRLAKGGLSRMAIHWLHGNGEDTGLPSQSFDIVSLAYIIHECPKHATRGLLKEAFRILKPGGTIAITDNSPKSKILQSLPPALFTLMKSTEPWMDEYYSLDLEETMREIGFIYVKSGLTDPRHRTATGTRPTVD